MFDVKTIYSKALKAIEVLHLLFIFHWYFYDLNYSIYINSFAAVKIFITVQKF